MKIELPGKNYLLTKIIAFILVGFSFAPFLAKAQTRGTLKVVKDPLLDTLIARRPILDKQLGVDESATGYRVQIYFGSSRQAAYDAQAKFSNEYQEYHTYITYSEPNFRVRVGDFKARMEAERLLKDLSATFTTLFIVSEKITQPKTDQE